VIDVGKIGDASAISDYSTINNTIKISNSELKGRQSIADAASHAGTLLVNNSMLDGSIWVASPMTAKCFNTFDANYMPVPCQ
jgi:hypothetical protein